MSNKIIITSSTEISSENKALLELKLKNKIGDFPFEYKVDADLIAGFTVSFGDKLYSYDLKSEIKNVQNQMFF
jgi:F0F1-type ATP synthase delta subunit